MWYFNFLERHGHEPDVQESLVEDFDQRMCTNSKIVVECLHDGHRVKASRGFKQLGINTLPRRFPCSACSKNKRNRRWADYKARDLIKAEKRKIVKENISKFQEECRERRRRDEEFWSKVIKIRLALKDTGRQDGIREPNA